MRQVIREALYNVAERFKALNRWTKFPPTAQKSPSSISVQARFQPIPSSSTATVAQGATSTPGWRAGIAPPRRVMFIPPRRVFCWRSRRLPITKEEKQATREREKTTETAEPNEISVLFCAEFANLPPLLINTQRPDVEPFRDFVSQLSFHVSDRMTRAAERAERKKNAEKGVREKGYERVTGTALRFNIKVDHSSLPSGISTKNLDDLPSLDVLMELRSLSLNNEDRRIVWLPYPIDMVSLPVGPRLDHPLVAAIEYRKDGPVVDSSSAASVARFFWFVCSSPKQLSLDSLSWVTDGQRGTRRLNVAGCAFRCEALTYMPTAEDIGKYIVVAVCQSKDEEESIAFAVKAATAVASEEKRPLLSDAKTQWCRDNPPDTQHNGFRVLAYNILSDTYLNLNAKELFYPYCPKEFQHMKYRYPALLKEIQEYSSDILLLQEVCPRMGKQLLPPFLLSSGYQFDFSSKFVEVREGSMIAWKTDRFELISKNRRWLTDELRKEKENEDILKYVESYDNEEQEKEKEASQDTPQDSENEKSLRLLFVSRPTQVHMAELHDVQKSARVLCVVTHLHHKPQHEHVKMLQALLVRRAIEREIRRIRISTGDIRVRVLFAADMNCTPDGPAYRFMECGSVGKTDPVWQAEPGREPFRVQADEEVCHLTNISGCPPFTNYTLFEKDGEPAGFSGCIDYVWSDGLASSGLAPSPSAEEVTRHVALPSCHAPSDHIPILINLRYID